TSGGLLVSIDAGATFATRNLGASFAGFVNSIIPSGERVYAATDHGVAVSADKGQTFAMRTTADGLGSISVRRLVLAGSTLYVATGAPWISGATNSFAISTDSTGASFTPHAVSPSHLDLRTDSIQVEGTTVRVGAHPAYYLSTDGGLTFVPKDLRGPLKKIT